MTLRQNHLVLQNGNKLNIFEKNYQSFENILKECKFHYPKNIKNYKYNCSWLLCAVNILKYHVIFLISFREKIV